MMVNFLTRKLCTGRITLFRRKDVIEILTRNSKHETKVVAILKLERDKFLFYAFKERF
jgi:hypothetical protein